MAKKKQFEVPIPLLEQLNECSGGGFMLFIFDENGIPACYNTYDTAVHANAMHMHIINWAKAIENLMVQNTVYAITEPVRKPKK